MEKKQYYYEADSIVFINVLNKENSNLFTCTIEYPDSNDLIHLKDESFEALKRQANDKINAKYENADIEEQPSICASFNKKHIEWEYENLKHY